MFIQACTHVPKCLLDAFVKGDTVPQIFVHNDNKRKYIGGCDALLSLQTVPNPLLLTNSYSSRCSICIQTPAVALKV
jgi:hypothetical protein